MIKTWNSQIKVVNGRLQNIWCNIYNNQYLYQLLRLISKVKVVNGGILCNIVSCTISDEIEITIDVISKKLWIEGYCAILWGVQYMISYDAIKMIRKVSKKTFFWDFVPNIRPHPPTAHVWDSTKWKVEVRFILLFGMFRAFCLFF